MSDEATGSVQIGTFTLTVGGAGGTSVQSSATPAAEGTGTLAQALVEPEPKEPSKAEAAAETVEDASGVTAKCERAVTLSKGLSEGKVFDPDQLGAEVGALLDLLEKLDRKGRHKEALKIARALATLLMLMRRWQMLLQTLRTALGAAEKLGDLDAIAWAKNELGALRLVGGDVKGAERDLHQAREIRERIGDRRGLATTNRNLGALCEQLQQMIRREELVRTGAERDQGSMRDESRRPSFLRLLLLAVLFALGFAGGVLAGNGGSSGKPADFQGGGGGPHPTTTTPGGTTTTSPRGTTTTTTTTEPTTTGPSEQELKKLEEQKLEEEQHRLKETEEEERRRTEEEEQRRIEEEEQQRQIEEEETRRIEEEQRRREEEGPVVR